jgi:Ser/Thr protein kinase RdoA (MazF antagonist)
VNYLIDDPLKSIDSILSNREENKVYLHQLADKLRNHISFFQTDELEMGFCHGDFHRGNGHIAEDGTITFFDFDCCGWGWLAYDIAVFRWGARHIKKEKLLWEQFIKGYKEERILNEVDLKATQLFVGVRHLWLLGMLTSNGSDFGFGFMDHRYFDNAVQFLKEWEEDYLSEMR